MTLFGIAVLNVTTTVIALAVVVVTTAIDIAASACVGRILFCFLVIGAAYATFVVLMITISSGSNSGGSRGGSKRRGCR